MASFRVYQFTDQPALVSRCMVRTDEGSVDFELGNDLFMLR